jgi:lipopolysaccharide transport system permease protein
MALQLSNSGQKAPGIPCTITGMARTLADDGSEPAVAVARFIIVVRSLVRRDFSAQYRRTVLGPVWSIAQPVGYTLVFVLLRESLTGQENAEGYALFVLSAMVPWAFFSNAISRCGPSLVMNAPLIRKIGIQKEVFPVSATVLSLLDLGVGIVIAVALGLFSRPEGSAIVFLWLPVLSTLLFLLALGMGLFLSAVTTLRRDLIFGLPFVLQIALLVSPVFYTSAEASPRLQLVLRLNPMTGIIESFRDVLMGGASPDGAALLQSVGWVAVVWIVSWPVFRWLSAYAADVV